MNQQIDPRGPRFGAAITTLLAIIGLYLGLEQQPAAAAFTVTLFVLFAWSVFLPTYHPYALVFSKLIRPRLKPPSDLEDARPPRFAQQVGYGFAILGVVGLLTNVATLSLLSFAFIFAAAYLNWAFDFCLGCQMYLVLKRFGLLGK